MDLVSVIEARASVREFTSDQIDIDDLSDIFAPTDLVFSINSY